MSRTLRAWREAVVSVFRRKGSQRDTALLLFKAALATVVAWQFAVRILDSHQPFYAPMAALLVVDRTMVRSIGSSVQRLAAVIVGMLTAWLVGSTLGVHWWSMLPVIYLGLLIARWRRLGDHGIQVPTMVLLSLLTVGGTDTAFTYLTVVETLAGGVIGVLINAVVLPPLHIREPREQVVDLTDKLAGMLSEMAKGLREGWSVDDARSWFAASVEVIDLAPAVQEEIETGRESTRLNPRDNLMRLSVDWEGYANLVEAVRRAQWQVAGIARTLVDAADEAESLPPPSPTFLSSYADVLDHVGAALGHFGLADEQARHQLRAELVTAHRELDRLAVVVQEAHLDNPLAWTAYGSLLLDARRLTRQLELHAESATLPTDSGPIRRPRTIS